jgi:hypothetical protein
MAKHQDHGNDPSVIPLWNGVQRIELSEIAPGKYLTRTQCLRKIKQKLALGDAAANGILAYGVSKCQLICFWQQYRIVNPELHQTMARSDIPPRDIDYWLTTPIDPQNPDLIREPTFDYVPYERTFFPVRSEDECEYRMPLFLDSSLDAWISDLLKRPCTEADAGDIRLVLSYIYAEADPRNPPNIVDVVPMAQIHLKLIDRYAKQDEVKKIAMEPCFKAKRKEPGRPPKRGS